MLDSSFTKNVLKRNFLPLGFIGAFLFLVLQYLKLYFDALTNLF